MESPVPKGESPGVPDGKAGKVKKGDHHSLPGSAGIGGSGAGQAGDDCRADAQQQDCGTAAEDRDSQAVCQTGSDAAEAVGRYKGRSWPGRKPQSEWLRKDGGG